MRETTGVNSNWNSFNPSMLFLSCKYQRKSALLSTRVFMHMFNRNLYSFHFGDCGVQLLHSAPVHAHQTKLRMPYTLYIYSGDANSWAYREFGIYPFFGKDVLFCWDNFLPCVPRLSMCGSQVKKNKHRECKWWKICCVFLVRFNLWEDH